MARARESGALLLRAAALLALASAAASALASCDDWVTLGPAVECGRPCDPPPDLICGQLGAQYDKRGRCVCAKNADCPNYPCELPPERKCFISGFNEGGACVCFVPQNPGPCGESCVPSAGGEPKSCDGGPFEYNENGVCDCAPATCPCGRLCRTTDDSDCAFLKQYNAKSECVCAPVDCPDCSPKPCCSLGCGKGCTIPGCSDVEGVGACAGFCDEKNECIDEIPECSEVP